MIDFYSFLSLINVLWQPLKKNVKRSENQLKKTTEALARSTNLTATGAVVEKGQRLTVNERGRSGFLMIKLATVEMRMTVTIDMLLLLLKLGTRK